VQVAVGEEKGGGVASPSRRSVGACGVRNPCDLLEACKISWERQGLTPRPRRSSLFRRRSAPRSAPSLGSRMNTLAGILKVQPTSHYSRRVAGHRRRTRLPVLLARVLPCQVDMN